MEWGSETDYIKKGVTKPTNLRIPPKSASQVEKEERVGEIYQALLSLWVCSRLFNVRLQDLSFSRFIVRNKIRNEIEESEHKMQHTHFRYCLSFIIMSTFRKLPCFLALLPPFKYLTKFYFGQAPASDSWGRSLCLLEVSGLPKSGNL